jgi:hypothetical protein
MIKYIFGPSIHACLILAPQLSKLFNFDKRADFEHFQMALDSKWPKFL